MLDDFHGADNVELCSRGGKRLSRIGAVIDLQPRFACMGPGDADDPLGRINPRHPRAIFSQCLAEQPSAATDIEQRKPLKAARAVRLARQLVKNIAQAQWIDLVQRPHGAPRVPPRRAKAFEPLEIGRVNGS